MSSSLIRSKSLGARRLRQDLVTQKESRLRDKIKLNYSLREKQLNVLEFFNASIELQNTHTDDNPQEYILDFLLSGMMSAFDFQHCGLMRVNQHQMLELYGVTPEQTHERIEEELGLLRNTGAIIRMLQNNQPALKESTHAGEWLVYHAIRTDQHILGLFVGILPEKGLIDSVALKLFDVILRNTAYALNRLNTSDQESVFRLNSEQADQNSHRMKFIPDLDRLTGLATRDNYFQHLHVLAEDDGEEALAVVSIDIDGFSRVNDTYGHEIGDQVLVNATQRLQDRLSIKAFCEPLFESDKKAFLARIGEDEFGLILPLKEEVDEAQVVAFVERIVEDLGRTFVMGDVEISIASSAGICLYPGQALESELLVLRAESARRRLRKVNDKKVVVYTNPDKDVKLGRCLLRERELIEGLQAQQFNVLYQPKIDLKNGAIIGAEALVRWQHPKHGLMMPEEFIPLAEQSGLINKLGESVLREACCLVRLAEEMGCENFKVSVNLSPVQIGDSQLVEKFNTILKQENVKASQLDLELTETCVIEDIDAVSDVLNELSQLGFSISIDDFGTGNASLSMVKQFPVDTLKIDQGFIQDLEQAKADQAIVNAVVAMGRDLNLHVLAEGVESAKQLECVKSLGCDQVQGFYLARPSDMKDFKHLLQDWQPSSVN